jgi:hypothetical protein
MDSLALFKELASVLRSSEKVANGYGEFIDVRSAGDEKELMDALQARIARVGE